jgi:hypothetical protein
MRGPCRTWVVRLLGETETFLRPRSLLKEKHQGHLTILYHADTNVMMFEFEGHDVFPIQRRFRPAKEGKDHARVVHSACG